MRRAPSAAVPLRCPPVPTIHWALMLTISRHTDGCQPHGRGVPSSLFPKRPQSECQVQSINLHFSCTSYDHTSFP